MNKDDYLLPKEIECPYCKTDLELEEEERLSANFICPQCNKEITEKELLRSFANRIVAEKGSKTHYMDVLSNTKKFLTVLAVLSIITGIFLSEHGGLPSILGTATGLMVLSVLLAAIPLGVYKLLGKDMSSEQLISIIAVSWIIIVLLQIIVKLNN